MLRVKQCSILIKIQRARDDEGGKVYIKTKIISHN